MSEVTQMTPLFSRAVEMRAKETHLPYTPTSRCYIKYHEIISVISMEICLHIINTPTPLHYQYRISLQVPF